MEKIIVIAKNDHLKVVIYDFKPKDNYNCPNPFCTVCALKYHKNYCLTRKLTQYLCDNKIRFKRSFYLNTTDFYFRYNLKTFLFICNFLGAKGTLENAIKSENKMKMRAFLILNALKIQLKVLIGKDPTNMIISMI